MQITMTKSIYSGSIPLIDHDIMRMKFSLWSIANEDNNFIA